MIVRGDCLAVMSAMAPASIDAIVTDPPYGLSFMGKGWDHAVPGVDYWTAALAAAKPGAHLLAFGGTRTYHRLACAIEDAGWEIRDCMSWLYGSGFPKSLDVSKAIDKVNGEGGRALRFTAWMRGTGLTCGDVNRITGTSMGSHYLTAASQPAIPTPALWAQIRPHCGEVPAWVDQLVDRVAAEREVIGSAVGVDTRRQSIAHAVDAVGLEHSTRRQYDITAPATEAASAWHGWGTALKPSWEPIIMARKPLSGRVADNVLEHGTGALNVDGCRVSGAVGGNWSRSVGSGAGRETANADGSAYGASLGGVVSAPHTSGRWPANVALDEDAAAMLDAQLGELTSGANPTRRGSDKFAARGAYGEFAGQRECVQHRGADSGGPSRFFYCAKASRKDRTSQGRVENRHPTVKPNALMRWLVRLVTPPGGLVLDPFAGSGTTAVACAQEGVRHLGVELDQDSADTAAARERLAQLDASEAMPLFAEGRS